jgi:restriction system protein
MANLSGNVQLDALSVSAQLISGSVEVAPPSLLLQALVTREKKVADGYLVQVLHPAWTRILSLIKEDPNSIHCLSPVQFEELIAASYDKAGFDEVILTPRSGDLGRDVIAIKRGWGSVRIIDQAKCFAPGHLVTANDVRALLGVLQADHGATKGVVSTTAGFAPGVPSDPFIAPFVPYRLELVDGKELMHRLSQLDHR